MANSCVFASNQGMIDRGSINWYQSCSVPILEVNQWKSQSIHGGSLELHQSQSQRIHGGSRAPQEWQPWQRHRSRSGVPQETPLQPSGSWQASPYLQSSCSTTGKIPQHKNSIDRMSDKFDHMNSQLDLILKELGRQREEMESLLYKIVSLPNSCTNQNPNSLNLNYGVDQNPYQSSYVSPLDSNPRTNQDCHHDSRPEPMVQNPYQQQPQPFMQLQPQAQPRLQVQLSPQPQVTQPQLQLQPIPQTPPPTLQPHPQEVFRREVAAPHHEDPTHKCVNIAVPENETNVRISGISGDVEEGKEIPIEHGFDFTSRSNAKEQSNKKNYIDIGFQISDDEAQVAHLVSTLQPLLVQMSLQISPIFQDNKFKLTEGNMESYITSKDAMEIHLKNSIRDKVKEKADVDKEHKTVKDLIMLMLETLLVTSGFSFPHSPVVYIVWDPGSNLQVECKTCLIIVRDVVCPVDGLPLEWGDGYYIGETGQVQVHALKAGSTDVCSAHLLLARVMDVHVWVTRKLEDWLLRDSAKLQVFVWDPGIFAYNST